MRVLFIANWLPDCDLDGYFPFEGQGIVCVNCKRIGLVCSADSDWDHWSAGPGSQSDRSCLTRGALLHTRHIYLEGDGDR